MRLGSALGNAVRRLTSGWTDGPPGLSKPCGSDADAPLVFGGRIHIHQAGFGIAVPDDWLAFDLWHPDLSEAMDDFDDESRSVVQSQRVTTALLAGDVADWRNNVYVDTWPGDDLTLADLAVTPKEADEELYADIRREQVVLPSGFALHSYLSDGPQGSEEGATFEWVRRGWYYLMDCLADTRHDDLWLSIAETFEFMPEEE